MTSFSPSASVYIPTWMRKPFEGTANLPLKSPARVDGSPSPQATGAHLFTTQTSNTADNAHPSSQQPPLASTKRNIFSVSHTASLASTPVMMIPPHPTSRPAIYSNHLSAAAAHLPPSPKVAGGSPSLAKRVPTRMSPAMAPMSIRHMNPNAVEFVSARTDAANGASAAATADPHGAAELDVLPTSTADMEAQKQQQKLAHCAAPIRSPLCIPSFKRASANISPLVGPLSLNQKSEMEILEISKHSALKAEAAAYMPRRTMARVVLSKPSLLMPSSDPSKAGMEMILDDLWCLFYLPPTCGESIKEENYNPILAFRIESIPTFWRVFNSVPAPTDMDVSTLYLFRDGIDPMWEHAANRNGGILKVKVDSSHVDEAWELLLCHTIGDAWSPGVRNLVNGVALKVRERGYILEVWVTKQSPELMRDLANLWDQAMGGAFAAAYYSHETMQNRAQAAATAQAEKQKKMRKRY